MSILKRSEWKIAGSVALLALLVFGVAGTAKANTIVETAYFGPSTTDWSTTISVAQFNSSWGVLNSVTVAEQVVGSTSGNVNNPTGTEQIGTIALVLDSYLDTPNSDELDSHKSFPTLHFDLLASQSSPYGPYTNQTGGSDSIVYTGANMSYYEGAGNVSFGAYTVTGYTVTGGGGNVQAVLATSAKENVTVTYDYTPYSSIPEPLSLVLLGSGLVGLGVFGRKRFVR